MFDFEGTTDARLSWDKNTDMEVEALPDGTYGKNFLKIVYSFPAAPREYCARSIYILNADRWCDFSKTKRLEFWVKGDETAAGMRDRIRVMFATNDPDAKLKQVFFEARLNENPRQVTNPDLFIESAEWKKIVVDLEKGPFDYLYQNDATYGEQKTFGDWAVMRTEFPWSKVDTIAISIAKFDSEPHKGQILFSRFVFLQ